MPMPPETVSRGKSGRITGSQGLTEAQAAFVAAYVANGANGAGAAETAGYADPRQEAYRLLRKPNVLDAIRLEQARVIQADLGTLAVGTLRAILTDPDTSIKMKAIKGRVALGVLDRAGHVAPKAPEAPKASGEKPINEMTIDELDAFIAKGQAYLEAQLKNVTPVTIEGEAVLVEGPIADAVATEQSPNGGSRPWA